MDCKLIVCSIRRDEFSVESKKEKSTIYLWCVELNIKIYSNIINRFILDKVEIKRFIINISRHEKIDGVKTVFIVDFEYYKEKVGKMYYTVSFYGDSYIC
jgi:hypothetical protein